MSPIEYIVMFSCFFSAAFILQHIWRACKDVYRVLTNQPIIRDSWDEWS